MSTTTTATRRPSARAVLAAARALIARAERRAATCGGRPNEYISAERYEALRAAVEGEPPAQP